MKSMFHTCEDQLRFLTRRFSLGACRRQNDTYVSVLFLLCLNLLFSSFQKLVVRMISSPRLQLEDFPPSVQKLLCLCLSGFIYVKEEIREHCVGVFDVRFHTWRRCVRPSSLSFPPSKTSDVIKLINDLVRDARTQVWLLVCVQV